MEISIVIPVYNEGEPLFILYERLVKVLSNHFSTYEIVLIDDRSPDDSWQVMKRIAKMDTKVKIARFIKNFGQHNALSAGIAMASGDYIVLMDCDQQDEPENIPALYNCLIEKNVHIIYALRENRKDTFVKRFFSVLLNLILEKLSGFKHDPRIGTFRIFTKVVKNSFLSMPERNRYIGGMFFWLNFNFALLPVEHSERKFGKSNYTFRKQLKLARLGILSSSTKLLSIGVYLGIITSILSLLFGLYYVYLNFRFKVPMGYTSLIVSIFLSTGMILFVIGIMGEYIREVYEEVKRRPSYIVEEKINFTNEQE